MYVGTEPCTTHSHWWDSPIHMGPTNVSGYVQAVGLQFEIRGTRPPIL
jgi:hypothetical protein